MKMDQSLTLMDSTLLLSRRLGETSSKRNCLALKRSESRFGRSSTLLLSRSLGETPSKREKDRSLALEEVSLCCLLQMPVASGEVLFLSDPVARERNVGPFEGRFLIIPSSILYLRPSVSNSIAKLSRHFSAPFILSVLGHLFLLLFHLYKVFTIVVCKIFIIESYAKYSREKAKQDVQVGDV